MHTPRNQFRLVAFLLALSLVLANLASPLVSATPSITSISVNSGPTAGGEEVILHGNEFIKDETETIKDFSLVNGALYVTTDTKFYRGTEDISDQINNAKPEALFHDNAGSTYNNFIVADNNTFCFTNSSIVNLTSFFDAPLIKVSSDMSGSSLFLTQAGSIYFSESNSYDISQCNISTPTNVSSYFGKKILDINSQNNSRALILTTDQSLYVWRTFHPTYNPVSPEQVPTTPEFHQILNQRVAIDSNGYPYHLEIPYSPTNPVVITKVDAPTVQEEPLVGLANMDSSGLDTAVILNSNGATYTTYGDYLSRVDRAPANAQLTQYVFRQGDVNRASIALSKNGEVYYNAQYNNDSYVLVSDQGMRVGLICYFDCEESSGLFLDQSGHLRYVGRSPISGLSFASPNTPADLNPSFSLPTISTPQITSILFGDTEVDDFEVLDANTIRLRVPAHSAGNVPVSLVTRSGETVTLQSGYTYLDGSTDPQTLPSNPNTADRAPLLILFTALTLGVAIPSSRRISKRR